MTWAENILFSIIEGLTEFLPVSSTGHLMMAAELMNKDLAGIDTYIITIQFGAILAVVALYYKKFFNFKSWDFYLKLLCGFIPAAVLGFLFDDMLEEMLQTPVIVGFTLILVGIFLLFIHRVLPGGKKTTDTMTYTDAAMIGIVQCVAMIPGVSRSAATIAGALSRKMDKVAATEFSFFLAVPTLTAAAGYKLLKNWDKLSADQVSEIAVGNIISFVVAIIGIKLLINVVKNKSLALFGVYRIVVGAAFLAFLYFR